MKLIRSIIFVALTGIPFARAELPASLVKQLRTDMTHAMTKDGKQPSESDLDGAVRELSDKRWTLNPGALAEYEAGDASISAVVLQEEIKDFEAIAGTLQVPKMVTYYVSKSKVEVLSPNQRLICYLLIKSASRHVRAAAEE